MWLESVSWIAISPVTWFVRVRVRGTAGAGGVGMTQMFPWLDNRDAEFLVWKTRTNEFPHVLWSKQMKVVTPQVVLLWQKPKFRLAEFYFSVLCILSDVQLISIFFSHIEEEHQIVAPILISCLLQWVVEADAGEFLSPQPSNKDPCYIHEAD